MKKISRILVGGMLVAIGCGCFLYPNFRELNTQREVEQIIEIFDKTHGQHVNHNNKNEDAPYDDSAGDSATTSKEHTEGKDKSQEDSETDKKDIRQFKNLYDEMIEYNHELTEHGQDIVDAWSYEQQPLELSLIDADNPIIGYIEIPDMKIRLPLLLGASPDNLKKGAAVLSETSMPIGGNNTNCVIAGHRGWEGSAYFQYIENMKQGSRVYVTNPWETLVYECTSTKVIYPDDIDSILIQPGKDMLTLFTCHPYRIGGGPYRYLVFCERVDTQKHVDKNDNQEIINPHIDTSDNTKITNIENADVPKLHIAQIQSNEGFNLLALEQTLRYILPIMVVVFSIIIILFRIFSGRKTKIIKSKIKRKRKHINKKEKKRRTLI